MSEPLHLQKIMVFVCNNWDALGLASARWILLGETVLEVGFADAFRIYRMGVREPDYDAHEFAREAASRLRIPVEEVLDIFGLPSEGGNN